MKATISLIAVIDDDRRAIVSNFTQFVSEVIILSFAKYTDLHVYSTNDKLVSRKSWKISQEKEIARQFPNIMDTGNRFWWEDISVMGESVVNNEGKLPRP